MTSALERIVAEMEERADGDPPQVVREARAELKKMANIVRHVRAIYNDGQLDKYPTSDSGPEYKLWRLVATKKEIAG